MEKPSDVLRKLGMTGILTLLPEEGGVSQLLCDVDESTARADEATSIPYHAMTKGRSWTGCQRRNTGRLVRRRGD